MRRSLEFSRLLKDVRVIDFTRWLAGPHLTRSLAQAGAEVIKIEEPASGDMTRALWYKHAPGTSGYFKQQNLCKQSVALDLASPHGRERAIGLIQKSQVVVENFRPGVMRQLGLDFETVRSVQPSIIYLSISGWGQTGPFATRSGEVRSTTAFSGFMDKSTSGQIPQGERCAFADLITGVHGLTAVAMALLTQARSSRPQARFIDLSILETLMATSTLELPELISASPDSRSTGTEPRHEGDHARVASGCFRAKDERWVYVRALEERAWGNLARTIGLGDLADLTMESRRAYAASVYSALETYCASQDSDTVVNQLMALGATCVPVRSYLELVSDPTLTESGLLREVPDEFVGPTRMSVGFFASSAVTTSPDLTREPMLGEHTEHVVERVLQRGDLAPEAAARQPSGGEG